SARVPNRVAYLVEGTSAWSRAGLQLESGNQEQFAAYSREAAEFAARHAPNLAAEAGVQWISQDGVERLIADKARTTYLLDVRLPEQFAAGHLEGSISSPGGQLLAVSHRTVAVRGATIVLIDDSEGKIRAVTTTFWLRQRGWDALVYEGALQDRISGISTEERETALAG